MGHAGSGMHDVGLDFIGQNSVIWPQLTAKATDVIHLCAQKEMKMNLMIAQLFVFTIDTMEGRGHGLRHGDDLEEFLRTGAKIIAVAMGVVRELDKTAVKLRRLKSHSHALF